MHIRPCPSRTSRSRREGQKVDPPHENVCASGPPAPQAPTEKAADRGEMLFLQERHPPACRSPRGRPSRAPGPLKCSVPPCRSGAPPPGPRVRSRPPGRAGPSGERAPSGPPRPAPPPEPEGDRNERERGGRSEIAASMKLAPVPPPRSPKPRINVNCALSTEIISGQRYWFSASA